MDLVRLSAASGFAVMAVLAGLASSGGSRAEPLPAFSAEQVAAARVQRRIDDAFSASDRRPSFDVTGPLFLTASGAPVLPSSVSTRGGVPVFGGPLAPWSAYIDEASRRFGVPAEWVRGVMLQESGGRTHIGGLPITSSAGAMGLMQVMPATFAEMRTRHGLGPDPYDPRTNILAGTAYLRAMYDRYGAAHFLAAYNAGPGRIDAWLRGRSTLPAETRAYSSTLLPRLGFAVPAAYASGPGAVQDLTSREAMSALLASPSRPPVARRGDIASASVFATASTRDPTSDPHGIDAGHDGLFVILGTADRRRQATSVELGKD